jgi:hypothetical protein
LIARTVEHLANALGNRRILEAVEAAVEPQELPPVSFS